MEAKCYGRRFSSVAHATRKYKVASRKVDLKLFTLSSESMTVCYSSDFQNFTINSISPMKFWTLVRLLCTLSYWNIIWKLQKAIQAIQVTFLPFLSHKRICFTFFNLEEIYFFLPLLHWNCLTLYCIYIFLCIVKWSWLQFNCRCFCFGIYLAAGKHFVFGDCLTRFIQYVWCNL